MMLFTCRFLPDFRIDGREKSVAIEGLVDFGHDQAIHLRHRIGIDLRAADDEGLIVADQCLGRSQ
ncbi:hypothetical protein D3C81_2034310 [compost metagenome]